MKYYSASVKNELTVVVKTLGLPLLVGKCEWYLLLVHVIGHLLAKV